MNTMFRVCLLAVLIGSAPPAFAQEDPPVPEDPVTADPAPSEEPLDPEPVSDDAPIGTVESVDDTSASEPPVEETIEESAAAEEGTEADESVEAKESAEITPPEEEEEPRVRSSFSLRSLGVTLNNLDMRPLNNETFIDIYDSDDRATLAWTSLRAGVEVDVTDDTEFEIGASHTGSWGQDSIGAANALGGVFYVDALNVEWEPIDGDSFGFETKIGRQRFSIGGAEDDFFFDDVVDGVTLELEFGKAGQLRLLPFDVAAVGRPDEVNFGAALGYAGPDQSTGIGFDGDTNSYRFGGVYELTELVDGLEARLFGFYADIGADTQPGHTGADRSFNGAHGNFADNDYSWMGGTRIGYTLDGDAFDLGVYGEFARSGGVDRKPTQVGVRDVTANGNAFGAAIQPRYDGSSVDFDVTGQFFMADGGAHTGAEGLLFNYGFVSMKGAEVGGLLMDQTAGWHPTAYVGSLGHRHTPQNFTRKAGTLVIHGGVGVEFVEKVSLDLDMWWFKDNGSTNLSSFDNLGVIADELPFGYTEADLIPQERLGRSLGIELDGRLQYDPSEFLAFYTHGGVFLPGSFYEIEIPRTGGTALGAEDPATFWALLAGATLKF